MNSSLKNGLETCRQLRPKLSDLPPAPDDLLKTIRLTARKTVHRLAVHVSATSFQCSVSCGECRRTSCLNPMEPNVDESATDSDIDDE